MEPPSALRGCVDVETSPRSVSPEIAEEDSRCTNLSLTQGGIITICVITTAKSRRSPIAREANRTNHLYHEAQVRHMQ